MIQKPKAVPAASASTSTPAKPPATPAPAVASTPAPPAAPIAQTGSSASGDVPATPTPAGTGASAPSGNSSGLAMGAERAAQIAEMESMGFERSQIDLAMRAAFFNSERAIEYLLTGIPENLQQEQRAPPAADASADTSDAPPAAEDQAAAGVPDDLFERARLGAAAGGGGGGSPFGSMGAGGAAGAGAAPGGLGNLDFLRNNAQFQQLRQVVQQNPQMLEPILQQVGAGNPQLAALIGQHPEQFLQLLSEDGDNDAPLPPGAQATQISVTEPERAAIERVSSPDITFGFPRDQAIQAYFACDKNEELAANFLFDQPDDEME
ncbi:putative UV excision repair protein rhp23 [Glarea lozoyensis 74030]|uniref:UV excision repair protein RAD23 n=1 Tax=Glarea lozoyensis (strain ATCC 74030 / MF5533) TaxID=1104152 RepID=H0EJV5_GLAL7|nr:putative UV excision repair protein rhp23 [Glarea lozoyensis 74030]